MQPSSTIGAAGSPVCPSTSTSGVPAAERHREQFAVGRDEHPIAGEARTLQHRGGRASRPPRPGRSTPRSDVRVPVTVSSRAQLAADRGQLHVGVRCRSPPTTADPPRRSAAASTPVDLLGFARVGEHHAGRDRRSRRRRCRGSVSAVRRRRRPTSSATGTIQSSPVPRRRSRAGRRRAAPEAAAGGRAMLSPRSDVAGSTGSRVALAWSTSKTVVPDCSTSRSGLSPRTMVLSSSTSVLARPITCSSPLTTQTEASPSSIF